MKKRLVLPGLFLLLQVSFVMADLGSTMGNVWDKVLSVGNLEFLGLSSSAMVVAFTRILIWILVFAIIYAVARLDALRFMNKNQKMVIAGVFATISAIFMPVPVILAVGSSWATLVAFLLIGAPIVAIGILLFNISNDSCPYIFLKLMLCFLLLWLLAAMQHHIGVLV